MKAAPSSAVKRVQEFHEMAQPLPLRLTEENQLKYSYDTQAARAQLLIHERAFAFVDKDPFIAQEGVYRAALCRGILDSILAQKHIPTYLRSRMEAMLPFWQDMSTLPPLRPGPAQDFAAEGASNSSISDVHPRKVQGHSQSSRDNTSLSQVRAPSPTLASPQTRTFSSDPAQLPPSPARQLPTSPSGSAPGESEAVPWHRLISQPTPSTAKRRLELFCQTHYSQTRRPDVYKPYLHFETIGKIARLNVANGTDRIERSAGPVSTADIAWLEEELCRKAIAGGIFHKASKNKMPKAIIRPLFLTIASRYGDLGTLSPNPKPQLIARNASTMSIVDSSVRNAVQPTQSQAEIAQLPIKPSNQSLSMRADAVQPKSLTCPPVPLTKPSAPHASVNVNGRGSDIDQSHMALSQDENHSTASAPNAVTPSQSLQYAAPQTTTQRPVVEDDLARSSNAAVPRVENRSVSGPETIGPVLGTSFDDVDQGSSSSSFKRPASDPMHRPEEYVKRARKCSPAPAVSADANHNFVGEKSSAVLQSEGTAYEGAKALTSIMTNLAMGKMSYDEACEKVRERDLPDPLRQMASGALEAIWTNSAQYLIQQASENIGSDITLLPKSWLTETLSLL